MDAKPAFDLSNKVCGEYRVETEGDEEAKEVESEAWHAFLAFKIPHHILAERSSMADKSKPKDKSKGKAKSSGE